MYTLPASTVLSGVSSVAAKVTCTIFGAERSGGSEVYKILYQGQLPSSVGTLYTVPSATEGLIRTIVIVNTDTVDRTFTLYAGGTADANKISGTITLSSNGAATYEDGTGWGTTTVQAAATLLNDVHSGYSDYQAISNPATPGAGVLRLYARQIAGRAVLKWTPPSGLDTPIETAWYGNNKVVYMPNNGTTAGLNLGAPWAVGTTIGHPTPSAGMWNQVKRTTSTNVVTTTNQVLGVSSIVSGAAQFWRGTGAGQGGFFFFARFAIETLTAASPNATRLFVGLQSGTTSVLASDTIPAISCVGLWHDTTDGANVINLLTKDGTTATKNALTGAPSTPYATGQAYDFYMFCKPNDSTIYYRLDDMLTGNILVDSSVTTTIPAAGTFMGPVCGMSNGTANLVASTVAIGVNRVYVESDH